MTHTAITFKSESSDYYTFIYENDTLEDDLKNDLDTMATHEDVSLFDPVSFKGDGITPQRLNEIIDSYEE